MWLNSNHLCFTKALAFRKDDKFQRSLFFIGHQLSGPIAYNPMVRCMNELTQLYVVQSDYEKVEELFEQGRDIGSHEFLGKDYPFKHRHVNGLGVLGA